MPEMDSTDSANVIILECFENVVVTNKLKFNLVLQKKELNLQVSFFAIISFVKFHAK
jgi:hypothetical protein